MNRSPKNPIILLTIICYCLPMCKNTMKESMQPYDDYQFIGSKEEISRVLREKSVDTIHFAKGEIIADIGAGNGSVEAMLSIFHDSLTFFIQDIDTSVCNQKAFNEIINFYQGVNGRRFTNKFIVVNGGDSKTNLPDDTFDKILMLWTYSYFKNPREIMTDVRIKLKNEGLLYVINPDIDYDSGKQLTSEYGWNASPIEKEVSDIIDCGFELLRMSRNYDSPEKPYILVFKKRSQFEIHEDIDE